MKKGHRVIAMDDCSGGFRENVPEGARFVEGSVTDAERVDALFKEERIDIVYHLAAYAAEGLSHFIRRFNYTNNLIGSVNLINAAVRAETVHCFVFTSSIAVYGEGQLPLREDALPRPEDPYGISKLAVELDLEAAQKQFGLNYVIFRPHNVYGERQNLFDPYRNVVGIFMRQALLGKEMTVFGDGRQTRAFSHHSQVCPIIAAAPERPEAFNRVFNVGAGTATSVLELAQAVSKAFGRETALRHLPARNEVKHAYSSQEQVRSVFGDLIREVPLEEGIAGMAAWARTVELRDPKPFAGVEVERGLPESWRALLQ